MFRGRQCLSLRELCQDTLCTIRFAEFNSGPEAYPMQHLFLMENIETKDFKLLGSGSGLGMVRPSMMA
ncbi:hypothetical protein DCAR_0414538 [Daucus carota subsp. sativus]|uniref:Uncharacterized protein n=1 Tax=Daucus carota subsp. sativus TaxID=79200 RepID=A0A175YBN7_DAUCS|nr:hypothetical protein DCAR_0414538 [Daucus carota subsp. sativus]